MTRSDVVSVNHRFINLRAKCRSLKSCVRFSLDFFLFVKDAILRCLVFRPDASFVLHLSSVLLGHTAYHGVICHIFD